LVWFIIFFLLESSLSDLFMICISLCSLKCYHSLRSLAQSSLINQFQWINLILLSCAFSSKDMKYGLKFQILCLYSKSILAFYWSICFLAVVFFSVFKAIFLLIPIDFIEIFENNLYHHWNEIQLLLKVFPFCVWEF